MKKLLTAKQMQQADRSTIREVGIPGVVLMENAGAGVVAAMSGVIRDFDAKKYLVVCGKGNNGGDGFVIARRLHQRAIPVQILLIGPLDDLKGDALTNAKVASRLGIPIEELTPRNLGKTGHLFRHAHVIVDAVFGTGLTRSVTGFPAQVIRKINSAGKFVVAVDIPSGIDSDSGQASGPHVEADLTCALAEYKRSHWLFPAVEAMGRVERIDIGIPTAVTQTIEDPVGLLEMEDIAPCFPRRKKNTHKGTYGHLLVVAGSRGKEGAAGLTALSALRSGTGLVTLAGPASLTRLDQKIPLEIMTEALPETPGGALSEEAAPVVLELLKAKTALALGPGLGTGPSSLKFLETLLPRVTVPMVLDADGLNLIARSKTLLKKLPPETILTPHPKEMSRLAGMSTAEIQKDRINTVQDFCRKTQCVLVLKGAHSLIGLADGRLRVNPTGNAGMATAGAGDVLTGMIGGFLAQGLTPEKAAISGTFLHGLAGDLYRRDHAEATLAAGDLPGYLSPAFRMIQC